MVIDEYKRYINPQVEIFLSLAASYKVSSVLASQSLGQLEVEAGDISPRAMKQAIMTNCRNKLCFNGIGYQDAQEFADEFGKDKIMLRQSTYKHRIFMPNLFPHSYRDTESEEYRFDPTDIMDNLPKYSFIHKVMYEAAMQKPSLARGNLVPADWKEKKAWETKNLSHKMNNLMRKAVSGTIRQLKRVAASSGKSKNKDYQPTRDVALEAKPVPATTATNQPGEKKAEEPNLQQSNGISESTKQPEINTHDEVQSVTASQANGTDANREEIVTKPGQQTRKEEKVAAEEGSSNRVKSKQRISGDGFWD